jgi:Tfp pilus assembly protein FimV
MVRNDAGVDDSVPWACVAYAGYTGHLNDDVDNSEIDSPPEDALSDEVAAAELALAELIVEAMDACVKDGSWDPRTGVEGLERLLSEEANCGTTGA